MGLCFLALPGFSLRAQEGNPSSWSAPLSGGWEYSWDAFPRNSSGSVIWDYDSIDTLSWRQIEFPSNPPDREGKELVWFRVTLPGEKLRDPSLFIFSIDINAEFFIDGTLLHQFGTIDQDGKGSFIGWPVQLIELPEDCAGKHLYIRVFSDYRDIGLWGRIMMGNRADLLSYMYRQDIFGIAAMIISLIIGCVFFVTYLLSGHQKVSLYLSVITVLLAFRIFGQLYVQQRIIPFSLLFEYIDISTAALIPIFITSVFRSFLLEKFKSLTGYLWKAYLGVFVLAMILSVMPFFPVHQIYTGIDISSLIGVVSLGYISVHCLCSGTREQKLISVNFLIMAVLICYSLLMSYNIVPFLSEFDYLMVLQFCIGLAIILSSRFFILYHTYEKQSFELANMNRTLEQQVLQRTSELEDANKKLADVNAQLKKEKHILRVSAITDGLTGLYNRAYIEEQFRQFIRESSRYGKPFSLAMFDLDHFKKVNDEFGHHVGDEVLRKVADSFHDLIRETDIAGRFGGEEFLLLYPQTDHSEAMVVTERIRVRIGELSFEQGPKNITISAGVAQYSGESPEEILAKADKNLYSAKQNGRNRVV